MAHLAKEAKPRIFVSATTSDLGIYRRIAADALHRGGLDPICQNRDFSPDYCPPQDMLRNEIDKCDAVICLIGFVYGSEPPARLSKERRSYTHWEYHFARDLGKPTFVFLATENCRFDSDVHQSEDEERLQLDYRANLSKDVTYGEFGSNYELEALIGQTLQKIKESVTSEKVVLRMVNRHFPTPLARHFTDAYSDHTDPFKLFHIKNLFYETLRVLALLGIQDSLTNPFRHKEFPSPITIHEGLDADEWLNIIGYAYGALDRECFIPELKEWYQTHIEKLKIQKNHYDEIRRVLSGHEAPTIDVLADLSTGLIDLYKDLYFFRYYLVVAIGSNHVSWLLQGGQPKIIMIEINPDVVAHVTEGDMFLIKPFDYKVLMLRPFFRCLIESSGAPKIAPIDRLSSENVQYSTLLSPDVFGKELLSEKTWQDLINLTLPPDQLEIVGGRYCIEKPCAHTGAYADIFRANVIGNIDHRPKALHLLRPDQAENVHSREWLKLRFKNWRHINHPSVLRPLDESDPESTSPLPYIVVDWVEGGNNLEHDLFQNEELDLNKVIEIVRRAADVCRIAHDNGLRLLDLPPRHFLVESDSRILLTGFDTICRADIGKDSADNPVSNIWRRFPKDRMDFAPEIRTLKHFLPATIDIFALGVLFCRLRNRRFYPMTHIENDDRVDQPWAALEFHCLAEDPELRFQTVEQFLMFLPDRLNQPDFNLVEIMYIPPGDVTFSAGGKKYKHYVDGFWIGKYPVTNAEYQIFCGEKGYPPPDHRRLGSPGDSPADFRLSAPLCPVVGISLEDASAYCEWLSKRTGERWRLPYEKEWIRAARLETDDRFPWGDDPPEKRANYGLTFSGPTVVGAYPDGESKSGCLDMSGNVWEWCLDYAAPRKPGHRLKGGSFDHSENALTVEAGHEALMSHKSTNIGFRVIKEGG